MHTSVGYKEQYIMKYKAITFGDVSAKKIMEYISEKPKVPSK